MSVGISPEQKYLIVEQFQSCGNKTKTGLVYDVSPRTVGRIMNEYNWIMEPTNVIYATIFKEMNVLVMPDISILDIDLEEFDSMLVSYGTIDEDETVDDYVKDYEEPIGVVIERILTNDIIVEIESDGSTVEAELDALEDEIFAEVAPAYEWQLVATSQSITITRTSDEGTDSVDIAKGTDNFRKAWGIIRTVDMAEEEQVAMASEEIYTMADPKLAIETFTQGNITVDVKKETLYYNGTEIHNSLTNRIIDMTMNRGIEGGQALLNFLEKLMENPSYRAVNSLYDFLDHNDIEIASNGNFYAWKRVRENFTDCHTGKVDNSVGATPSMPRNMVNEDPEQTCSYGLHVAAKHYLSCFHGPITLRCEINPKDVVAVPNDYNNSKMRTCRYEVVEDVSRLFNH